MSGSSTGDPRSDPPGKASSRKDSVYLQTHSTAGITGMSHRGINDGWCIYLIRDARLYINIWIKQTADMQNGEFIFVDRWLELRGRRVIRRCGSQVQCTAVLHPPPPLPFLCLWPAVSSKWACEVVTHFPTLARGLALESCRPDMFRLQMSPLSSRQHPACLPSATRRLRRCCASCVSVWPRFHAERLLLLHGMTCMQAAL